MWTSETGERLWKGGGDTGKGAGKGMGPTEHLHYVQGTLSQEFDVWQQSN